jgi:hypothetical protein
MPNRLLRLVVVVLLTVTVPLQGMAAVAAGQCMAMGHHQDAGGPDTAHAHDGADEHGASHDGHDDGHDDGKSSHCGPCAACCASASIAASASLLILGAPANTKYVFSQFSPRGVQPHGIDRPPLSR